MTKGTKELYTNHLFLRPFTIKDSESSYHNWLNQEEVFIFMDMEPIKTIEECELYVSSKLSYYHSEFFYDWCIEEKASHNCIGEINAVRTKDKKGISIGYCLGKEYWKKGYMKESLEVIIHYFFDELNYEYIEADCVENNIASIHLLNHFGFKRISETTYQLHQSDI